jgi:hypothetical protein
MLGQFIKDISTLQITVEKEMGGRRKPNNEKILFGHSLRATREENRKSIWSATKRKKLYHKIIRYLQQQQKSIAITEKTMT